MGLFKKKSDPISERARALNDQIADLEKEITRLANKLESEPPPQEPPAAEPAPAEPPAQEKGARIVPAEPQSGPRLRSTAFPQSQVIVHAPPRENSEPVFEELPNNPFKANGEEPQP